MQRSGVLDGARGSGVQTQSTGGYHLRMAITVREAAAVRYQRAAACFRISISLYREGSVSASRRCRRLTLYCTMYN